MKTVVPPSADPEFGVAEVKLTTAGAEDALLVVGDEARPPPQLLTRQTTINNAVPAIQSRWTGRYSDLERLIADLLTSFLGF
jgi:hypothetical protein